MNLCGIDKNIILIIIITYISIKHFLKKQKIFITTHAMQNSRATFCAVTATCKLLFNLVKDRNVAEIYSDFASFWKMLTTDKELNSVNEKTYREYANKLIKFES